MKVDDIFFAYDKTPTINGVSFEIKKGKITTFMGANGCGKSTLFSILTKNLRRKSGLITLDGIDIDKIKLKNFSKKVSIVHQYNTAPPDLLVHQLVSYGRLPFYKHFKSDKNEDKKILDWALEVTNLTDFKNKPLGKLSGGQRQRAWIAMALAQSPTILFLDEPTTYLDIKYQIEILKLIENLNKNHKVTIVMVLHDINQAIHYSDEVIGMKDGKILFQGNPQEVITSQSIHDMYEIQLKIKNIDNLNYVLAV